ncbi:hypothetical protein L7F22_000145 [Adiantum nelumboides]|nr:hypothetical protein [Adiantum nelumboides]
MAFCKPDDFLFQRRSSFQILRCGLFGKGNGRNFLCVAQGDARCPEAKMFPSQDVHMADHFPRRSSLQILTALEGHVQDSGKELLAALKDVISLEKEIKIVRLLEKDKICLEKDLRLREKDLRLTEKEDLKNRADVALASAGLHLYWTSSNYSYCGRPLDQTGPVDTEDCCNVYCLSA